MLEGVGREPTTFLVKAGFLYVTSYLVTLLVDLSVADSNCLLLL